MDPTTGIVIGTVGAQFATLFTLMFNARQARLRAERQRVEELEDRKEARKIELEDRATLAAKVEQARVELVSKVDERAGQLHQAIAENTEETKLASQKADAVFVEANHSNTKITTISERISDLNQRLLDREKNINRPH